MFLFLYLVENLLVMKETLYITILLVFVHLSTLGQINYYCTDSDLIYETPQNFKFGSMENVYLTYQELLTELDLMKQKYPNLISTRAPIGDFLTEGTPDNSVTPSIGGNPLEWVRISDNPEVNEDEPEILYDSLIHGQEWGAMMQLVYYMWYLLENYETDPVIKQIIDNAELYFIPVVNPDGFLFSQVFNNQYPGGAFSGRKNRKDAISSIEGVDINRNFNYFIDGDPNNGTWGTGNTNTTDPSRYDYAGSGPFSEMESQAVKWFVEQNNFLFNITNHSFFGEYGGFFYYPFNYNVEPTPEDEFYKKLCSELVIVNNNTFSNIFFPAAGLVPDFMYGTVGTHNRIFSILTEIPSSNVLIVSRERLIEINKEMLSLNLKSAQIILNYATIKDTQPLHIGKSFLPDISFQIERIGLTGTGNFTISIEPLSNNILYPGDPISVSGLQLLEEFNGKLKLKLNPSITAGDEIIFNLVVNNGLFPISKKIRKLFGEADIVFQNNGEVLLDDFEVTGSNIWEISEEDYTSAPASIRASTIADEISYLTSKRTVDLTNATSASVSFFTKWNLIALEFVEFEVSIDSENWDPLCGKLTRTSDREINIDKLGYTKNLVSWTLEEIDLKDYIGEVIHYRFKYDPFYIYPEDDFWLDDIKVNVVTKDLNQSENSTLIVYPNPVQDILYINTNYKNYTFSLFDPLGRLIITKENVSNSQYIDNSIFSTGIYFLRINLTGDSKTFKIVKL